MASLGIGILEVVGGRPPRFESVFGFREQDPSAVVDVDGLRLGLVL